jgi:hypothetical protein
MGLVLFDQIRPNIFVVSHVAPTETLNSALLIHAIVTLKFSLDILVIETRPIGGHLIKQIANGQHPIFIHLSLDRITSCCSLNAVAAKSIGKGSASLIRFNLFSFIRTQVPDFIVLAHELIHARHNQLGEASPGFEHPIPVWASAEEFATIVGLSKGYSAETSSITENAIRAEHGFSLRTCYALTTCNFV